MNGGNLMALQKHFGHYSLNIMMRYFRLATDYLKQAVDLNPLSKIKQGGKEMEGNLSGIKKPVACYS
jgi:hypothetical protein